MYRRYTQEEKQIVLQRLIFNNGDVPLTSLQTGVKPDTIYKWRKIADLNWKNSTNWKSQPSETPPHPAPVSASPPPLAEGDLAALQALKRQMLEDAYRLSHSVEEAIPQSTLPERVIALTRLVDRIYKLAFQLPFDNPDSDEEAEEVHYIIAGTESFETQS